MLISFIYQLFLGIIVILITYSVGKLILGFFSCTCHFFFKLFITYVIGITSIILFYSLIKSGGKTIFILLIPLIIGLFYHFRKYLEKPSFNKQEVRKELKWSFGVFIIIFLYQSYFFFDFNNNEIKSIFWDNYAYATFVDSLKLWGLENSQTAMNFYYPEFRNGLIPYHYPELWLSAFFSEVFSNSSLKTYYLHTNSLLICVYLLGINSLLEQKIKRTISITFISFLLLFVAGLVFPFYENFDLLRGLWFTNMSVMGFLGPKTAIIYVYVLLSIILIRQEQKFVGTIVLLGIPIFSTGFLPGIWGGIILFYGIKAVSSGIFKNKKQLLLIFFVIFYILLYYGFYYLHKSSYTDEYAFKRITESGIFKGVEGGFNIANFKIVISNFIYYSIPTIIKHIIPTLIFFFPLLLIFQRTLVKNKQLWIFVFCAMLCGATASTLSHELLDSIQFTTNLSVIIVVLIVISFTDFIALFLKNKTKWNYISLFIFGMLLSYTIISTFTPRNAMKNWHDDKPDFFSDIATIIDKSKEPLPILVFYDSFDFSRQPFYFWYNRNDAKMLTQYLDQTLIFTLGNPELYIKKDTLSYAERYYYFDLTPVNVWKREKESNNLESFITHYNIKYFYFKGNAEVPEYISRNADTVITSTITHSKFYKLKSN